MNATEQRIAEIEGELDLRPGTLRATEDGLVVTEDGEVVGVITPAEFVEEKVDGEEPPLMSEGLVNWVMSKRLKYEAARASAYTYAVEATQAADKIIEEATAKAIAAAKLTPEYLEAAAVERNASKMVEKAEQALVFFDGYTPELGRYAAANLTGKSKTLNTPFGSISLRKNPDKIEVVDERAFELWAGEFCPTAIVTTFKVSEIPKPVTDFVKKYPTFSDWKNDEESTVFPSGVPVGYDEIFRVVTGETKVTVSANIEGVKK